MKDELDVRFSAGDSYSGVRMQQGAVQQDSDWNESAGMAARQITREVSDTFSQVTDLAASADSLVRSPALGNLLSDPAESAFRFDPETGALRFGDGVSGEAPPTGARVEAAYRQGAGGAGNLAMVQPFPLELDAPENSVDMVTRMLEVWSALADKLTAYQEMISEEAYLPSAGRSGEGGGGGGEADPVGGLIALLHDTRELRESFAQRLERARTDSPPSGDDD